MMNRRLPLYSGIGIAGLLLVGALALTILWVVQAGEVLPNTTLAGVDVSGLSEEDLRQRMEPEIEQRQTGPVTFTFEDRSIEVVPTAVGYEVDSEASIQAALGRGRQGLPGDIVERVRSLRQERDLSLVDDYDPTAVTNWAESVADEVDREPFPGAVSADPETLDVSVEMPHGRAEVRQGEATELLISALRSPGTEELELPVDTEPQRVPDEDVEAVASQVERALSDDLTLTSGEESLVLTPNQLARLIEVVERSTGDGATLEIAVSAATLADEVDEETAARFEREPRDAAYVVDRAPPVTFDDQGSTTFEPVPHDVEIEPGRDGTRFDPELAAEQLTELLRSGARGGELRLETMEADFSTAEAERLRPTHLLGTFTTYHPAGQSRVVNIQLLADEIDGTRLEPGEQFSINEISGPRSCSSGYRPAGTIVGGELTDTCGGGTSQFGTTTFNAAFFAGVQLDQWKAHSWYFSRYPMGREATLNFPELDVKFTNDTEGTILVRTSYTSGSITVSLYGQPIASEVRATLGNAHSRTEPSVIRRDTDELYEDQERVEQGGFGGFTVDVERTIEYLDGDTETETIRTVYVPQNRIIEVGTRERPEPEPDPEEPADEQNADEQDDPGNQDTDDQG